jgi:hypothetical protein
VDPTPLRIASDDDRQDMLDCALFVRFTIDPVVYEDLHGLEELDEYLIQIQPQWSALYNRCMTNKESALFRPSGIEFRLREGAATESLPFPNTYALGPRFPPLLLPEPTTVHRGPADHNAAPSDDDSKCGPHNRECLAQACAEAMVPWMMAVDAQLKKEPRDDCLPGWEHWLDETELLAVHRWFCASPERVVSPDAVRYEIFDAEYEGCLDEVNGSLEFTWFCPNRNCDYCMRSNSQSRQLMMARCLWSSVLRCELHHHLGLLLRALTHVWLSDASNHGITTSRSFVNVDLSERRGGESLSNRFCITDTIHIWCLTFTQRLYSPHITPTIVVSRRLYGGSCGQLLSNIVISQLACSSCDLALQGRPALVIASCRLISRQIDL